MAEQNSNAMQAQLGLGPGGSFSPVGIPTPQIPQYPTVKHPGEISVQATQMAQAVSMQTMQATAMTRPGAMGGAGFASPLGSFAQQYQANMAGMASQQFNPYYAQAMVGMARGGFGMMPPPTMMTDPSMGIFRPFPQNPAPMVPPVPQMPLIRHPMTPSYPSPSFQTPLDFGYNTGRQRGDQIMAAALAAPSMIARAATDIAGSYAGSAIGSAIGARFGGPMGARLGAGIGGIAGIAMSEMGGFGATAGHVVDRLNPFRATALRTAQMQSMSQDFVVGGPNLAANGRGLGTTGSASLARMMEDVAYSRGFRQDTGFSVQDLTRITRLSGDQGILDMAQSPQQIKSQITTIAKALKNFMQLAGQPDIAEAIKQVGQMRSMGLSTAEAVSTTQNARMFARMAGTSVSGLTEMGGLQGAMIFQQAGLSAGLGLQMGNGAYGMARQAVASGVYNPQQLAMLGGTSGIAQREMQSNAAFLKMPMLTAAMSSVGANGTFGLNPNNVHGLMNGKVNIGQMASMGTDNLMSAVAQHGVGAIGMFQMQQSELQDSIGRALGPVGMKMARMRQVMQTQQMLGIKGPGGFVTAAKAMGMSDEEARQMAQEANSPEFFSNMRRQMNVQVQDVRMQDEAAAKANAPGAWSRWGDSGAASGFVRGVNSFTQDAANAFRNTVQGTVDFFSSNTDLNGHTIVRTPQEMLASTPEQARMVAAMSPERRAEMRAKYYNAGPGADDGPLFTAHGVGYGYSSLGGTIRSVLGGDANTLRAVRNAEGSYFGGGLLERGARLVTAGVGLDTFAGEDEILRRGQAFKGGAEDLFAGISASDVDVDAASKRLSTTMSAAGEGDKAGLLQTRFASKLAAEAQKRKSDQHFWDPGSLKQLTREDMQKIFEDTKKELGVKSGSYNDAKITSIQDAIAISGAGTEDVFKPNSMDELSLDGVTRNVETVKRERVALSKEMFGTGDGLWNRMTGRSDKALSAMFNGTSAKVNALASLLAAQQKDPNNTAIAKKIDALKATGEEKRLARAKLKQMGDAGLVDDLTNSGTELLGHKDEEIVGLMQERNDEYVAGLDVDGTAEKTIGGTMSEKERALQMQGEGITSLQKDLGQTFPAAVDIFKEASRQTLQTMLKLGAVLDRGTSLGIPVPPAPEGH
jgi:hypothetical protein